MIYVTNCLHHQNPATFDNEARVSRRLTQNNRRDSVYYSWQKPGGDGQSVKKQYRPARLTF